MEEKIPGTQYDPLQYFLSDADWDWNPVTEKIAGNADKLLVGHADRLQALHAAPCVDR